MNIKNRIIAVIVIIALCCVMFSEFSIFAFAETKETQAPFAQATGNPLTDLSPILEAGVASIPPMETVAPATTSATAPVPEDAPPLPREDTDSQMTPAPSSQENVVPQTPAPSPQESAAPQTPDPLPQDAGPVSSVPVITAFLPLDEAVIEQAAILGTLREDLHLPKALKVTVEDAEGDVEEASLEPIEWSSAAFDAEQAGSYTFTPVMPWEIPPGDDAEEMPPAPFALDESVPRPVITVTVEAPMASDIPAEPSPTPGEGLAPAPLVIVSFAPLEEAVVGQEVTLGTPNEDLHLPQALKAMAEDVEGNAAEVTLEPVVWSSAAYDADQYGIYTFTAMLPWETSTEDGETAQAVPFVLSEGVLPPSITITVLAPDSLVITSFAPLEEAVAEQETTLGTPVEQLNLPETLVATAEDAEGNAIEVTLQPIEWSSAGYDAKLPGDYTFVAAMPWEKPLEEQEEVQSTSFTLAEGIQPPSLVMQVLAATFTPATPFADIQSAIQGSTGNETFAFEAGTYNFSTPIHITADDVTIQGSDTGSTIFVTSGTGYRHFVVSGSASATFQAVALNGPTAPAGGVVNGGIEGGAALAINYCTFTGNVNNAGDGGAVRTDGSAGLANCTLTGNHGTNGGGVFAGIDVSFSNCTLNGNSASNNGGGVSFAGNGVITGGTINGNTAAISGGGVNALGPVTIIGGSVSGNTATGSTGGGIQAQATANLTGCTITQNNARTHGGGIAAYGGLVMSQCTVSLNSAGLRGGGIEAVNATVNDCLITENNADYYGGGIYATDSLTISGGTISDNLTTISYGGGAYSEDTLTATGVTVTGNEAYDAGGGLDAKKRMTVINCTIESNIAGSSGAGLYCEGDMTVRDTQISNNLSYSIGNGGGIRVFGALVADNCQITGNEVPNRGGGISATGASTAVTNCIISGNTARIEGGGIFATHLTLTAGELHHNTASTGGGGGLFGTVDASLSGTAVYENTAATDGGGVHAQQLTLTGGGIYSNTATAGNGGGVYVAGPFALQNYHAIYNNTAGARGGGIYGADTTELTTCTVRNNTAVDGGGVYARGEGTFTASTLNNNMASGNGGGVFAQAEATLTNSTLYQNSAGNGGGAYAQGGVALTNCTLTRNSGSTGGLAAAGGMSLRGNIISGNGSSEATGMTPQLPTAPNYNLIGLPGITLADIFISATPVLANNGGPTQTVMISNTGEAVDVIPGGSSFTAADQRGVSRPHGLFADAGAVEISGEHIITSSAGTGGSIDPLGTVTVPNGGAATFRFFPDTGFKVSRVLVDGVAVTVSGNSYTFSNVRQNHTIHVEFAPLELMHIIISSAGPGGSISPLGTVQVADGGTAIFRFQPDTGYQVSRLLIDGVAVTVSDNSYTFSNVRQDHTIRVEFETISGNGGSGGSGGTGGQIQTGDYSNPDFWAITGSIATVCFIRLITSSSIQRTRRKRSQSYAAKKV